MKRTSGGKSSRPRPVPRPPAAPSHPVQGGGRLQEFDFAVGSTAPSRWPAISVCLIARDEAANLGPCLGSLGDLPSEVVVVDTGSRDDTTEVARALGARVHPFAWIDDFAAARNESLRHARGEWIFWLDADDRLAPETMARLKRAAASGRADAYSCLVRSRYADGSQDTTEHVRLFRNGLGIRFTGAIHERISPDLVRLGLRLAHTDILVEHTGYSSPDVIRRKAARNLPVIDHQRTLHPDQVELAFYRGQTRFNLGDLEGATADMREYLAGTRPSVRFEYRRFWAHAVLALVLQRHGARDQVEALLGEALAEFPGHPYFLAMLGRLHLALERAEDALPELLHAREALEAGVPGSLPSRASVEVSLAEASRSLGRKAEALRWAEQARSRAGSLEQAGPILARLYLETGRTGDAESLLSEILPAAGTPEPWLLLWELRFRQGRTAEAAAAMENARSRGLSEEQAEELLARLTATAVLATTKRGPAPSPRDAQRQVRALALLSRREYLKAAEGFAEAIEVAPSDPDNYRYLAVALRELGQEEEALEAWRLAEARAAQLSPCA